MDRDFYFAGSVPEIYDRHMVPLIFEPYARDLAARVAAAEPQRVLELAAGTGVVTRAMAAILPAQIVATDLNPPMLEQAKARQSAGNVVWQQADAMELPFADDSFDVVACQFGVMFFPDKMKAYREVHRVLQPGGAFVFSVWDRLAENAFAAAVTDALAEHFADDAPRFMARIPHGYYEPDIIRAELAEAGFTQTRVEHVAFVSRAPSPRDVALAYCQGTPMRNEIETRGPLEAATSAVTAALSRRFGDGPIGGPITALVIETGNR